MAYKIKYDDEEDQEYGEEETDFKFLFSTSRLLNLCAKSDTLHADAT